MSTSTDGRTDEQWEMPAAVGQAFILGWLDAPPASYLETIHNEN